MATLVLTAVGTAIGGPVGGAIGAMIGQQIDSAVFGGPARQGSRLKELAVQTSSYGTQVPAIFGAMRVAGTVIWSTDLIEDRVKSGGSKSRPATVNYSYRVSLAIALSSRPIHRIGRIWADGNLIRGSAGDLKTDSQFRYYEGHANQAPDPLLASAEAAGQCPAYRGLAYAIFEDLQIADFGNRIPSLTFEVFERDDPLTLAQIISSLSSGTISSQSELGVTGFAGAGGSLSEAISPLLEAFPVQLTARGPLLALDDTRPEATGMPILTIAAEENGQILERAKNILAPAGQIPNHVSLRYYDSDRDYQAGIQQSGYQASGRGDARVELPAVLNASVARNLVETKRADICFSRKMWAGSVMRYDLDLQPGDCFSVPGSGKWQIDEIEHGFGIATIKAHAMVVHGPPDAIPALPGRHVPTVDALIGESRILIVDAPIFDGRDPGRPNILVFAAGTQAGWRRASLSLNSDGELTALGLTAAPATMGVTVTALASHDPALQDDDNYLDIQLLNDAMQLNDRDGSPVATDAPTFWLGGAFMRVGKIVAWGNRQYRLSRFVRLHSPTAAPPLVAAGQPVVLVEESSARLLSEPYFTIGQSISLEAEGIGDNAPVIGNAVIEGLSVKPLSPVHGRAVRNSDGSMDVSWIRRSRLDIGWVDGVDQAMAEDREAYWVEMVVNDIIVKEWTVERSGLSLSASDLLALGISTGAQTIFYVRQIGRFAQSSPLLIN